MIDNCPVRQNPETGDWEEQVNGTWYAWNDRPLCSCEIADNGDAESGPSPYIAAWNPSCERHPPVEGDELLPIDEHPAFAPYLKAGS
jgi:hypothetical protein